MISSGGASLSSNLSIPIIKLLEMIRYVKSLNVNVGIFKFHTGPFSKIDMEIMFFQELSAIIDCFGALIYMLFLVFCLYIDLHFLSILLPQFYALPKPFYSQSDGIHAASTEILAHLSISINNADCYSNPLCIFVFSVSRANPHLFFSLQGCW